MEELRHVLTEQFSTYVRKPQVYVRPVAYRPIRVYVGGEVRRPGYYTLTGVQSFKGYGSPNTSEKLTSKEQLDSRTKGFLDDSGAGSIIDDGSGAELFPKVFLFPTVFDAIRSAEGITPYRS